MKGARARGSWAPPTPPTRPGEPGSLSQLAAPAVPQIVEGYREEVSNLREFEERWEQLFRGLDELEQVFVEDGGEGAQRKRGQAAPTAQREGGPEKSRRAWLPPFLRKVFN